MAISWTRQSIFCGQRNAAFVWSMRPRRIISRSCRSIWMKSQIQALRICDCTGEMRVHISTGKTVAARFNYDYNDEEIAEVAKRSETARARGEGSARRLQ